MPCKRIQAKKKDDLHYVVQKIAHQREIRLVLRFENGDTNRQQNIFNFGDTAQQICNVLVLCPIFSLLIMRLT